MRRAASLALAAALLAPASAGASAGARPALGLTATPARVALDGTSAASVRISNPGGSPVMVDIGRAGFSLDLRGRPRVVPAGAARAAASWLTVRPGRFVLAAGAARSISVTAQVPRRAEPGDHDALVLLTTRPVRRAAVVVRMRIGIVVVVRAPGRVVRRLELRGLHVRHVAGVRAVELGIVNRGNVTETLSRGRVRLTFRRGARRTTLLPEARDLRPGTRGVVLLRYRGALRGWVTASVWIGPSPGLAGMSRTYRVKL